MYRRHLPIVVFLLLVLTVSTSHAVPDEDINHYIVPFWQLGGSSVESSSRWECNTYAGRGTLTPPCMVDVGNGREVCSPGTICQKGCALTSLMMLYYWNSILFVPDADHQPKLDTRLDPGTLNTWMVDNSTYDGTAVHWINTTGKLYEKYPFPTLNHYVVPNYCCDIGCSRKDFGCFWVEKNSDPARFNDLLEKDTKSYLPDIMQISYTEYVDEGIPIFHPTHFVVVGGYDKLNGEYRDYDPGRYYQYAEGFNARYNGRDNYSFIKLLRFQGVYASGTLDVSNGRITLHSPIEVQIIDPKGRRTGYSPDTGLTLHEDPMALYYMDQPISDLAGIEQTHEPYRQLAIVKPLEGNFIMKVFGTGEGPYTIDMQWTKSDGTDNLITSINGIATPALSETYRITYSPTGDASLSQTNQAPVANAGANQTGEQSYEITLDGFESSDPDGDPLKYAWRIASKPDDSSIATLTDAGGASPTFTPDKAGTYVIELVVNDYFTDSEPSTVTINVTPLKSRISVTPNFSTPLSNGSTAISFGVNNIGRIGVTSGTLNVILSDPSGAIVATGTRTFSIEVGQTTTITVPSTPLPMLKFGNYTLSFTQSDETGTINHTTISIPNSSAASFSFDKITYRMRETANLKMNLMNTGKFSQDEMTVTLAVADTGYSQTTTVSLSPSTTRELVFSFMIPDTITSGRHGVNVTITSLSGDSITALTSFAVQGSDLIVDSSVATQIAAGDVVTVWVENEGAVDTTYATEKIVITDTEGEVLYQSSVSGEILAGERKVLTSIPIPAQTAGGIVFLNIVVKDLKTGNLAQLNKIFNVEGLVTSLLSRTDQQTYQSTDTITAISTLANSSRGVENGTLDIKVYKNKQPSGGVFTQFIPETGTSQGSGNGQFKWPQGIAVASDGSIYVADSYNHRIQKFDRDGNYITKWGSYGSGNGLFIYPYGIAVSRDGYVYVVDHGNNRIQKFNANGQFVYKWGSYGYGNGQFASANGIAIDSNGSIYVSDTVINRIQKFNANGGFITKWGSYGTGNGQFNFPINMAVGPDGSVYVVDSDNYRIQKFDPSGNFIIKWGSSGYGNGQFYYPRGIAVDANGFVYIGETLNNRVQKFDSNGNFKAKWGSSGSGDGQFQSVPEIGVNAEGIVYAIDSGNNRIQRMLPFSIGGSESIFETTIPINQEPNSNNDYTINIGSLNTLGKLYLETTLKNNLGQTIARSGYPFYIVNSGIVLFFAPDKKIYRQGETVTISGEVKNITTINATNLKLIIKSQKSDGSLQTIHTENINVPASGTHTFTTTATAGLEGVVFLIGSVSQTATLAEITDQYEIANPKATMSISGPDIADRKPFYLNVELKNTGRIDINIQYTVYNSSWDAIDTDSLTIPASETRLLQYNQQIDRTMTYRVYVTGDVYQTASKIVTYGEAAQITIGSGNQTPSGLYPEGKITVPVTITNTGTIDETISVTYSLQPSVLSLTKSYFLAKGETFTDTLTFDVIQGTCWLYAESSQPYSYASSSFTVARENDVTMSTASGSQEKTGLIPVTMNIVNNGYNIVNGTITLAVMDNFGKAVWRGETPVSGLEAHDSMNYLINLDPAGIISGAYPVEVNLYTSSGSLLATNQSQVRVSGPIFEITSIPTSPIFTVGKAATLNFTIKNTGTLAGSADFSVKAMDVLNQMASNVLQPGEEKVLAFNFAVPEDAQATDYLVDYNLAAAASQGTSGKTRFSVAGVNVAVTASLDKQIYYNDDTAVLTMNVEKQTQFEDGTYVAIIRYGAHHDMQTFTLTSQPATPTFNVPLGTLSRDRLFYGVYFQSGGNIFQNSLPINTLPVVTIVSPVQNSTYNSAVGISAAVLDGGLGIGAVEYRVDDGPWNTLPLIAASGRYEAIWQPVLADNGNHTVGFKASDTAGHTTIPLSVGFTVQMDTTPPVTVLSLGTPKYEVNGQVFVSGSTHIELNATDDFAGVAKTEYRVDEGPFETYTGPVELGAYQDGVRTITFRSVDNIGNIETENSYAVNLDKEQAITELSGSDPLSPGIVNIVSPKTLFTLNGTDNLSGVRTTTYRIDEGEWQGYTGSFGLTELASGTHTITYKSIDNVLNEEAEKSLTVRLIVIDNIEKAIGVEPVVLVGVWSDKSDREQKQADIRQLDALLASLRVNYMIAGNMDDFTSGLRSGRYNTYILIDVKEPVVSEELREAVYFGDGLIFLKTRQDANPFLDDVFGVKLTGKTTRPDLAVNLESSFISNEGELKLLGKAIVATISAETAQAYGTVMDKQQMVPVIISNQYGKGRSLLYTFDLLNSSDQTQAAALMVNSINHVRPLEHSARAMDSVPLQTGVKNSSEPVTVRIIETVPADTTADSIVPEGIAMEGSIAWQKTIASNENARFGYALNLPDRAGEYTAITEVFYDNNGIFVSYGRYPLTLIVLNSSDQLLRGVITDLTNITMASMSDAETINEAIDALHRVNANASTGKEAEDNLKFIIKATDEIKKLSMDVASIRLKLSELIKIWEKKWYLMKLAN